jgi:hypothetical protein
VIDKENEDQKKFIAYVFLVVLRNSCYGRKLTPEIYLQEILLLAYDMKLLCITPKVPIGEENNLRLNNCGTH